MKHHLSYSASLIACALALPHSTAADTPPAGKSYALLIGVNDYTYLSDLQFCGNDMQALREAFLKTGFEPSNVTLIHGEAIRKELLPFRNNIVEQLKLMLGGVKENDLVVVAFSGHGVHVGGKDYFCAVDSKLDDPAGTMVAADTVASLLQASEARQKVLIVDACRNDPYPEGTRSGSTPVGSFRSVVLDSTSRGFVVMRSCSTDQVSIEDPELGHGVFMNFVVNGLLGHADANRDKQVDLLELHRYADYETRTHVRVHRSMLQTPTFALPDGELVGSYVLARVANRPQTLDVQKISTVTSGPTEPSVFEIKLYDSAYNLFQQGKVKESIVAFEQLLKVVEHEQVRDIAKMKLASAYLSVDSVNNISKALAVQPDEGVTVTVLQDSNIMSVEEVRGTVKSGQMVRVTKIVNGWHFIQAVNGKPLSTSEAGFINKTAFSPAPVKTVTPGSASQPTAKPVYASVDNYGYNTGVSSRGANSQTAHRGVTTGRVGEYSDVDARDRGLAREADRFRTQADRLDQQGKPVQAFLKSREAERKEQEIQRREATRERIRSRLRGN
ncbi:MAG: caspase family protein [Planctomycetales bacterium]|nr:caspase family protein [Planctomycetales bacterium]